MNLFAAFTCQPAFPQDFMGLGSRINCDTVWFIDFTDIDNNDWLVLNQFTVIEARHNRRR